MSTISIFAGTYCKSDDVVQKTAQSLDYNLITDHDVFDKAARRFNISFAKFAKTTRGEVSVFNRFTHEHEQNTAFLKVVVADLIREQGIIIYGRVSRLIPPGIAHVLYVCLAADTGFRVKNAEKKQDISQSQAAKIVSNDDKGFFTWTDHVSGATPWDPASYDILIPMDKNSVDQASELIVANAKKKVLLPTKKSLATLNDFTLAAHVEVALAQAGHNVKVSAKDSNITLTINKRALMLSKLEDDLKKIASGLSGVKNVETKVGPDFHKADIYRKHDFEMPSKVLLVDDEQEFIQTLSDRLLMRDVGSAIVYDGKQALDFIDEDEPEVMVLDLNMPGMDGMEVLRRVKKNHSDIEVIILTGHGNEKDKNLCMDLGAFAYLEKPVDIEELAEKMREANQKAAKSRKA